MSEGKDDGAHKASGRLSMAWHDRLPLNIASYATLTLAVLVYASIAAGVFITLQPDDYEGVEAPDGTVRCVMRSHLHLHRALRPHLAHSTPRTAVTSPSWMPFTSPP